MSVIPLPPIGGLPALDRLSPFLAQPPGPQAQGSASFYQLLVNGVDNVNANLANADNMVRSFVLDDSIPVHQVTFALEQARLSLELMLQVRGRLVEAYQQLMNMQL